jgi:hypothetical protein
MVAEYPMELLLHLTGVIFTVAATGWAIYLIPLVQRAAAWVLLSSAFILFAAERVLELLAHRGLLLEVGTDEVVSDILFMVASIFLFGGVFSIRKIFLESQLAQRKVKENLDELQRFYNASIGRELRMKELFEENQALKTRLGEQEKTPVSRDHG